MFCFLLTLDPHCHDIIKLLIIVELDCSLYQLIILKVMLIETSLIGLAKTMLSVYSIIKVSIYNQCIIVVSFNNWDYCFPQRINTPLLFDTHFYAIRFS